MTAPLVSVIMPVRNGEPWLGPALASVLAQQGVDFELIVIDDGSTDATPTRLAACGDPRLRVIRQSGLGLVAALNAGLAAARGPLVARMDADDIALPGRLAAQAAILTQDAAVMLVHGAANVIDAADRIIGHIAAEPLSAAERLAVLMDERAGAPIIHPTVMMRRDALRALGGYRDSPCAEDHDLWLRAIDHWRFHAMADPVLRYRQHRGGVSRARARDQAISTIANRVLWHLRRAGATDTPALAAQVRADIAIRAAPWLSRVVAGQALRQALRQRDPAAAARTIIGCIRSDIRPVLASTTIRAGNVAMTRDLAHRWAAKLGLAGI